MLWRHPINFMAARHDMYQYNFILRLLFRFATLSTFRNPDDVISKSPDKGDAVVVWLQQPYLDEVKIH